MRWKNSRNSPFLAENRNTWSVNSTGGGGGLCTRAIHSLLQCGGTSKNSWPRFPFRRTNHHNVFSLFIFRIVQSILGSFSSRYTHIEVSGSRWNMWKKHGRNTCQKKKKKQRFPVAMISGLHALYALLPCYYYSRTLILFYVERTSTRRRSFQFSYEIQ